VIDQPANPYGVAAANATLSRTEVACAEAVVRLSATLAPAAERHYR
jgi:hypothetical protein